jgi:hypothetical protein
VHVIVGVGRVGVCILCVARPKRVLPTYFRLELWGKNFTDEVSRREVDEFDLDVMGDPSKLRVIRKVEVFAKPRCGGGHDHVVHLCLL